jgi:hypothetical protein
MELYSHWPATFRTMNQPEHNLEATGLRTENVILHRSRRLRKRNVNVRLHCSVVRRGTENAGLFQFSPAAANRQTLEPEAPEQGS